VAPGSWEASPAAYRDIVTAGGLALNLERVLLTLSAIIVIDAFVRTGKGSAIHSTPAYIGTVSLGVYGRIDCSCAYLSATDCFAWALCWV
jgi:hypothetical protein